MCIPQVFCGADLDDWLAYSTLKVVVVRDRYLGLLKYLLMLLILVYIGIFAIWLDHGYMDSKPQWFHVWAKEKGFYFFLSSSSRWHCW